MMQELFELSLSKTQPVTTEMMLTRSNNTYFNGDEVQEGDRILFALKLLGEPKLIREEHSEIELILIMLNERHFPLFECIPGYETQTSIVPFVKLKTINE